MSARDHRLNLATLVWSLPLVLVFAACFEDAPPTGSDDTSGDGDGDTSGDGDPSGDGDGDPSGDGDGDPSGDGDGDPSGDGDGDPSGDGDGDPSGDGDGDPLPDPLCDDGNAVPGEICFSDSAIVMGGDVVYSAHFADVNNDDNADIIYLLGDGTVKYHLGAGNGVFANGQDQALCVGEWMFVAALDPDNKVDMVCGAYQQVQALLGNGMGDFSQSALVNLVGNITAMWVGDFDDDLDVDVITAMGNDIRIDFNNGSGSFVAPFTTQQSGLITAVAAADFTNDGLPEAIIGRANGLEIRPGNGNAILFNSLFATGVTANIAAVASGDFNGDDKPDLVYADQVSNKVGWVLGFGGGSFLSPEQISLPGGPRRLAVADFDNDGLDDFAVGSMNNRVWIYRSLGDEGFAEPVEIPVAIAVDSLFADADANGDGVTDLIISNVNADTAVAILSTP